MGVCSAALSMSTLCYGHLQNEKERQVSTEVAPSHRVLRCRGCQHPDR